MIRGTTYQRKDGRWECRISLGRDENGKKKYRSFYGKSKEEAEYKMVAACQSCISDQQAITEMTVKELALEWLCVVKNRIKESTAANYRMKIERHIIPFFGGINCSILKAKTVSEFIQKKLKDGLSARYVCDIITVLKSIFRYASREYRLSNVVEGIVMPKKIKPEIKILSKSEQYRLKAYINANPNSTTLGIALSLYTGLRIGELCALKWSDIDIEKRVLTVRHTIQRIQDFGGNSKTRLIITEPKSQTSKRTIPIPNCLIPMLKALKGKQDGFVLTGTCKPIEPRTMQYRFKKILNNVKLPSYRFHSLRHAFASGAVELGFDVKTLSEILGHSSVQITLDRYVHSSFEHKRECMDLLTIAS